MDSRQQQQQHHHQQLHPPPPQQQPPHMPLSHHHHHHHHQQQQPPQPPNVFLGGNNHTPSTTHMIATPSAFPFSSMSQPPHPQSDGAFDAASPTSSGGMRFGIDTGKKKRGRPRKYATSDGNNIVLGLSPTPVESSNNLLVSQGDSGAATPAVASEPSVKRRGRPKGSTKKQLDALGGVGGVGFTPHVIEVKPGEDIASKIMAFSQQGPRTVCILSANGAVSNFTLRQPTMTGGTVSYEGRFEIISLSGSFMISDNLNRTGGLSVSVADPDGRVLGGGVAGMLKAASPVQVIVGSFITDKKKSSSNASKSEPSLAPPNQMLNFGTPMTSDSPPSQGASSNSSDENGGSPINQGRGMYGNTTGQPVHNMQMYHLWAGQNRH